MIRKNRP